MERPHQDPPFMNHANDSLDPLPCPTIYRLASERRYNEIPIHVQTHPHDIYWEDRYGSTALHILCCSRQVGDPLTQALDAIIQHDPSLIAKPNQASWTPLHLACEKRLLWRTNMATGDLVLKLVHAYPQAVSLRLQTSYKAKTPFHIACETNAVIPVLEAMLSADSSLAMQAYKGGETPMEILWQAQMSDHLSSLQSSLQKMEILLRAAYCNNLPHEGRNGTKSFSLLCAISSIRCPRDYVSRVISLHRDKVCDPDVTTGWLPLHYAILSAQEEDSTAYTAFLIERLLEEFPGAAMVPFRSGGGLLPLHVLVSDCGMTWHRGGVKPLVLASKADALVTPDPRSQLVPALGSAIHAFKSRQHLSTTFELLRLAPQVLQKGFFSNITD
jgi:ankyrin repeat protein